MHNLECKDIRRLACSIVEISYEIPRLSATEVQTVLPAESGRFWDRLRSGQRPS